MKLRKRKSRKLKQLIFEELYDEHLRVNRTDTSDEDWSAHMYAVLTLDYILQEAGLLEEYRKWRKNRKEQNNGR